MQTTTFSQNFNNPNSRQIPLVSYPSLDNPTNGLRTIYSNPVISVQSTMPKLPPAPITPKNPIIQSNTTKIPVIATPSAIPIIPTNTPSVIPVIRTPVAPIISTPSVVPIIRTPVVPIIPTNTPAVIPIKIPTVSTPAVIPAIKIPIISTPAVIPSISAPAVPIISIPSVVPTISIPSLITPTMQPLITGMKNLNLVTNKAKDVVLLPWQIEWAQRAYNILMRNHGYIDTSRMRSGKTYVTLWLAKQFGFRLLIICPVIAIDVWSVTAREYGVEVVNIISYQSLRSQNDHQPKHGLLSRYDNVTEGGIHQTHFITTKLYNDLLERGIMVICDEIQNIKNNSDQFKACNALIRPIITSGGRSRFGLLSGTPFDKEEHAVNLLKIIGYIRAHKLYRVERGTNQLILDGMQELIDACRSIDNNETERVLDAIPLQKSNMDHLCYILYIRVIKANISGAMAAPTNIIGTYDVKNGFYNMSHERNEQLKAAIKELAVAVSFNEKTGTSDLRAESLGALTIALVHIENAKIDDMARIATETLMSNNFTKVVISVNYTSTIEGIRNNMLPFNPLILNGKTSKKDKSMVIRAFNENPNYRLLLMNTAAGSVGISLYTPNVNSPRVMLLSPSYKLLDITQAAARIYGPGMISDAKVRMFYGKDQAVLETKILTSLINKSETLKGTLDDVVKRDLILPGDYDKEEEPNK